MLTFIHQQICFCIETQWCSLISEMNARMEVTGCEFLLTVYASRLEVEVAQSEVSGNI